MLSTETERLLSEHYTDGEILCCVSDSPNVQTVVLLDPTACCGGDDEMIGYGAPDTAPAGIDVSEDQAGGPASQSRRCRVSGSRR